MLPFHTRRPVEPDESQDDIEKLKAATAILESRTPAIALRDESTLRRITGLHPHPFRHGKATLPVEDIERPLPERFASLRETTGASGNWSIRGTKKPRKDDSVVPEPSESKGQFSDAPSTFIQNHTGNHALQDYQMQLMLIEQQNKRRLLMARQEQEDLGAVGGPRSPPFKYPQEHENEPKRSLKPDKKPHDKTGAPTEMPRREALDDDEPSDASDASATPFQQSRARHQQARSKAPFKYTVSEDLTEHNARQKARFIALGGRSQLQFTSLVHQNS